MRVAKGTGPDIIFITGDIANQGLELQYEKFIEDFIFPLKELLGDNWTGRIFMIPGNHDVDRDQAKAVTAYNILSKIPTFLDPSEEGLRDRVSLLPRFNAYVNYEFSYTGGEWLRSATGAFTDCFTIKNYSIGVLGINTAWFSQSDGDRHKL